MINFSVIIPAYNRADLIGNSIKSLIDQTISPEVFMKFLFATIIQQTIQNL